MDIQCEKQIKRAHLNGVMAKGFTLIELLVVISIIALLLAILMPALGAVKKKARSVVCRTNLKQFGLAHVIYAVDYDDKIVQAVKPDGSMWLQTLEAYYKIDDIRHCPSVTKPPSSKEVSHMGQPGKSGRPDEYWWNKAPNGKEYTSSYGMNGWVQSGEGFTWGNDPALHWGKMSKASGLNRIPLQLGDIWRAGYPKSHDRPGGTWETGTGAMVWFTLDRHSKGNSVVFLDGHAETVYLPNLWTLRWHRGFEEVYNIRVEWLK